MKPTSGTAPGTKLSEEVSYFFDSFSVWAAYFDKLETKDSHISYSILADKNRAVFIRTGFFKASEYN